MFVPVCRSSRFWPLAEIPYLRAIRLGLNNNILMYEKVCSIFQKNLTFVITSRSYENTRAVYDKL